MTPRRSLVLAAVAALTVVAVVVPLALRSPGGTSRHESPAVPAHLHVAERLGGAELLRAAPADGSTARGGQADPAALARAEQQFTTDLLRSVGGSGNVTVAPQSLALALAMLEQGARGSTEREIATVLHTAAMTADRQGAAWRTLLGAWSDAARHGRFSLDSATALWQQRGTPVGAAFAQALDRFYATGVWQVDFAHDLPGATDAINRWTSRQTHGRITQLFAPGMLDPYTRAVLADAVYFKAAWATPFDAGQTRPGPFTLADGRATSVAFMHAEQQLRAAVTGTYAAVELPYRGGRFAALAVLPRSGTLAHLVQNLTASSLGAIVDGLHSTMVDLALPRFTTSSALDLEPVLSSLGMPTAFSDHADLSGIAAQLRVQAVVQRTYLRVAERGTEAAAATGIGMGPTAMPAQRMTIRFDHPFLFLVRDTVTGTILFASQVADPTG